MSVCLAPATVTWLSHSTLFTVLQMMGCVSLLTFSSGSDDNSQRRQGKGSNWHLAVLGAEHLWCIGHGLWGVTLGKLPSRDNKDTKFAGSLVEVI